MRLRTDITNGLHRGAFSIVDEFGSIVDDVFKEGIPPHKARMSFTPIMLNPEILEYMMTLKLSHGERSYLFLMISSMHNTNSIDWTYFQLSPMGLYNIRKNLRKYGLIDCVKLGLKSLWYVNPFVAYRGKSVNSRLKEHFSGLVEKNLESL